MKIKINPQKLKHEIKKNQLSLSDLEKLTGINVNRWKYLPRSGGYVTDSELLKITDILQCDQNLIIDPDFQIFQNTPMDIDLLVRKLYERRKGDIQPVYEGIMRNFLKSSKIESFIGEANRLLTVLFSGDQIVIDPVPALELIIKDFQRDRIFSGSHAGLIEETISKIFSNIQASFHQNSAQQALAVFLYVLVIFDVIFLEESIASVTQFTTERFGDKAEQYCLLTQKTEILRDTLINHMIIGDLKMGDSMVEEITEEILDGVHLILLACHRAGKHLNSDYFSSEYVNRAELDAIITRLTRIIENIGIQIPPPLFGMSGTRFFNHLCLLRSMFKSKRPEKRSISNNEACFLGFLIGKNING